VETIDDDDGGAARLILPTLESVRATLSHRFGDVLVAVTAVAGSTDHDGAWSVIDCIRCGDAWCLVTRLSPAGAPERRVVGLSNRERVIAAQVAAGAPLKVVAATLSISIQAVATYLSRVKR
jgi:DNA-binding CsgD family transcriptional regulator